jgi:hypothetical protein
MRNEKKKTLKEDQAPVMDGDTRPDMQSDGSQKLNQRREKKGKDFSSNRAADVNSLEDYKDKKAD